MIEQETNYCYGITDTVRTISIQSSLLEIKIGFIEIYDLEDNQYSISVLEEALIRSIRSGMEKTCLVTYCEEMVRPLGRKIELLSSHESKI